MAAAPSHPLRNPPNDEVIRKIREMSMEKITVPLTPRSVRVKVLNNDGHRVSGPTLTFSELTLKDWLEHLQDIFNYNEIDSILFGYRSIDFNIDDIRELFGNKSKFDMLFLDSDACKQLILEKFFPIEKLYIQMSRFGVYKAPANTLIQNFEYLSIEDVSHEAAITLDELLITNSKVIKVTGIRLPPKDFNKFIKLWQQGSNLHMECFSISYPNNVELDPIDEEDEENFGRVIVYEEYNANTIMRGIEHDVVPANRIRKFKPVESKNPCFVHGGMDIYRNDGVKATIKTERMQFITFWHILLLLIVSDFNSSARMAQVPAHPLRRLPDDEIIRYFREMSLVEILKFSLISDRCKGLVKSIQIKGTFIFVSIGNDVTIFIKTDSMMNLQLRYYTRPEELINNYSRKKNLVTPRTIEVNVLDNDGDRIDITIFIKTDSMMNLQLRYYTRPEEFINNYSRKKKLATPRTIEVNVLNNDGDRISGPTLTYGELEMKDWLKHLQDIFNYHEIDSIRLFENSAGFDVDDIREVFGNKSKFDMQLLHSDVYKQLILEKFFPIERLSIMISSFQNTKVPANILIQNFEYLSIEGLFGEEEVITLEELLMTNSKGIKIDGIRVSQKDFNKFIKLWQQGSNSMEYLSISYPNDRVIDPNDEENDLNHEEDEEDVGRVIINEEYNANNIMRGIKHELIPANRIRKFKSVESKNSRLVHGGMDIHRNDGTVSTERSQLPSDIMAAIQTFPLLGLPDDVVLRTIRVMDLKQILKFSTVSKRCKNLVTFIKIKGTHFYVSIRNDITISIETVSSRNNLSYYTEPNEYWGEGANGRKKRLIPPQSVLIDKTHLTRQLSKWEKRDFTMNAWLEHLQNVFNFQKIDGILFSHRSSEFDIDDIREAFGNITNVSIENTGCLAFNQMILRNFFPIEQLTIMSENFRDSKIPPSLLMQNHATLYIRETNFPINVTLNDLLLINSKVISVENPQMPKRLLNNFIKLWQKGSNPLMEYLSIDYFDGEENEEQIIMKGIMHEVNPRDRVKNFKSVGFEVLRSVHGGMDIYRMDGMKATVTYRESNGISVWHMYTVSTKRTQRSSAVMASIPTFPLLCLPDDVVLRTIRTMNLKQILKFSTVSKRCKNLLTSIKIKGTAIHVSIENDINIFIETGFRQISLSFYTERNKYWGVGAYGRKKRLTSPQSVVINKEYSTRQPPKWKKGDFTMKTWLEHLQNVFNYHKIDSIEFSDRSSQFDIDDIKNLFGNIPIVYIENNGRFAFNEMILQHFFPIEELTIMAENFRDSKIPPSLLMQNFATLTCTESDSDEPTNFTLNDLLLINSKAIRVENFQMPQKLLNKFIKLWQKGSNPHMEYLSIKLDGEGNNEQIIMNGIKYEVNPPGRVRNFKHVQFEDPIQVYGGMDIYRLDGVKANINIEHGIVELFVWFDHCVVE
ncbi:unnamed protein product [Caenorhabditis brenneri]